MAKFNEYVAKLQEEAPDAAAKKAKDIALIDTQIDALKARIEPIREKIAGKKLEIETLQKQVDPLNDQLAVLYKKKADRGGLIA